MPGYGAGGGGDHGPDQIGEGGGGEEGKVGALGSSDERDHLAGAIAQFCARRRFLMLTTWLLVTIGLVGVAQRVGDNTNDNLSLPGTNSQLATDTLSKSFPDQANGTSPIVLHVSNGKLTDSKHSRVAQSSPGWPRWQS